MIMVCTEAGRDIAETARIYQEAGREDEARLVEKLRASGAPVISLVAKEEGKVLGHLMLSPVTLEGSKLRGIALGPFATITDRRSMGADALLIKAGLSSCRDEGYDFAVVAGEEEYYARFGFEKAGNLGLKNSLPGPDERFLARALHPGALYGASGTVHFLPELGAA